MIFDKQIEFLYRLINALEARQKRLPHIHYKDQIASLKEVVEILHRYEDEILNNED